MKYYSHRSLNRQGKLHLVITKNIVSIFSVSKAFRSMFWVLFVRKYSKLTKFIHKIDPNSRMPRIFMDLVPTATVYLITCASDKITVVILSLQ